LQGGEQSKADKMSGKICIKEKKIIKRAARYFDKSQASRAKSLGETLDKNSQKRGRVSKEKLGELKTKKRKKQQSKADESTPSFQQDTWVDGHS